MRKTLLGTTALVAAGLIMGSVTTASASDPIKLSVGGFMNQWIGFGNDDTVGPPSGGINNADLRFRANTEVYFRGSTILDNGIKVDAIIDMEADRWQTGNTDDVYMKFTSASLGDFRIGNTKGSGSNHAILSPDVGIGNNDGDYSQFVGDRCAKCIGNTFGSISDTDHRKIVYYTPVFGGFQAGAWVGHSMTSNSPANLASAGGAYISGYSAILNADLGGVGVGLAVSHAVMGGRFSTNHAGASLSMSGFTVGGGWGNLIVDDSLTVDTATGAPADGNSWGFQGNMWDIGVSYETGPYAVSLTYSDTESEGGAGIPAKDTRQVWVVSGAYSFAPGVKLVSSVMGIDVNDEANVKANENNAVGVAMGVKLSF